MPVSRVRGLVRGNGGALTFLVATSAVNLTNFGFHVVVSRALGTEAYGGLSALLVLIVVITVPFGALQLACTHAQASAEHDVALGRIVTRATGVGLAGTALVALLAPWIEGFFHLGSVVPILLLGWWIPFALVAAVPAGVLLGQQRYVALAVGTFVGGGLTRLLAAVVLTPHLKTNGGMLATVLAQAVSMVVFLWAVRRQLRPSPERLHLSASQGVLSLAAMIGLALATGVDTMLAQHVMPGEDASVYSAAAVAGRMALFAPAAVALIVFPRFVAARQEGRTDARLLWSSLGAVLALGLAAAGVLSVIPALTVRVLFGAEFAASAGEVPLLSLEGAALAVLSLLTYYHLARGGWTALTALVGSLGLAVGIWAVRPGVHALALLMAVAVVVLAVVTVVRVLVPSRLEAAHLHPVDEALVTEVASL